MRLRATLVVVMEFTATWADVDARNNHCDARHSRNELAAT
jgi:hypothetical protein